MYLYPFPLLMQATTAAESKAEAFCMMLQQNEIPNQINYAQYFYALALLYTDRSKKHSWFPVNKIKVAEEGNMMRTLFSLLGKLPSIRMAFFCHDINMSSSNN